MDSNKNDGGKDGAEQLRHKARFLDDEGRNLQDEERRLKDRARKDRDEADEIEERERRPDHAHGVKFTVVVNGQPVNFEVGDDAPLGAVRAKALELTNNVGRPAEDWELKDEAGAVLDLTKTVGESCFGKKVTLFLSLRAGVAG